MARGAIFLLISAKAMATLEFLQKEWINGGDFIGVGDERGSVRVGLASWHGQTIPPPPERLYIYPPVCIDTFSMRSNDTCETFL